MGLIYTDHFKTSPPPSPLRSKRRTSSSSSSSSFLSTGSIASASSSTSSLFSNGSFYNDDRQGYRRSSGSFLSQFTNTTTNELTTTKNRHSHHHLEETDLIDSFNKDRKVLRCLKCHTHICLTTLIISDNFTGESGPAYFVNKLINFKLGPYQEKKMKTGSYWVKNVHCLQCLSQLGWFYVLAQDTKQKYKENKFVIECNLLESVDY